MTLIQSLNFGFLEPNIAAYAIRAERYVFDDPNTSLLKLRQFGELLANSAAGNFGINTTVEDFRSTISKLKEHGRIPLGVRELFDVLRRSGNKAAHEDKEDQRDAFRGLIAARDIAIWFHKTFNDPKFVAGPFRTPPNPANADLALKKELDSLREEAAHYEQELAASQGENEELKQIKQRLERESLEYYDKLRAVENQQQLARLKDKADREQYEKELRTLRVNAKAKTPAELSSLIDRSRSAARLMGLRGEAAEYIPLAQIRVVSPIKSRCHKATKLLAQSSDGGFVMGFCTKCGSDETLKEAEFQNLDLWVSCPKCRLQMKASKVRSNYGFRCETCGWTCYLASLLPLKSELGFAKD